MIEIGGKEYPNSFYVPHKVEENEGIEVPINEKTVTLEGFCNFIRNNAKFTAYNPKLYWNYRTQIMSDEVLKDELQNADNNELDRAALHRAVMEENEEYNILTVANKRFLPDFVTVTIDGNQEDIQIQSEEQSSQLDTIPVQVFINLVCRQMELDPSKYYCYTQIGQRKHYLQDDSTLRRAILNQTEIFLEQFGTQQASFSDLVM